MDESSSEDETPRKMSRITYESESEDDALPGTATMSVAEVIRRASSTKKKHSVRGRLYSAAEDDAIPISPVTTIEEVADVSSSKKKKKEKKANFYQKDDL